MGTLDGDCACVAISGCASRVQALNHVATTNRNNITNALSTNYEFAKCGLENGKVNCDTNHPCCAKVMFGEGP